MKTFIGLCLLIFFIPFAIHAKVADRHNNKTVKSKVSKEAMIRSETGLNIPEWGIAIDALYDPRLDDLIPGYHIVNLVLTNRRAEPILLNVKLDRWIIMDSAGKKHKAYNHVEEFSKELWSKLPDKLRSLIEYPNVVNTGKAISIDVFIPKNVDLFNFREVIWKSSHLNKEFNIYTKYEKSLSINENEGKEFEIPKTQDKFINNPTTQTGAEDGNQQEEDSNTDPTKNQDPQTPPEPLASPSSTKPSPP